MKFRWLALGLMACGSTAYAYLSTPSTGGTWGSITGTLSSQTDLQSALNAKAGLTTNTFSGTQAVTLAIPSPVPSPAISLANSTAATANNQRSSPSFSLLGNGWKTNSTAASQPVEFRQYVLPVQGTATPNARWKLQSQLNSGGWTDALDFDTAISIGTFPKFTAYGTLIGSFNNSSTIGTLQNLNLINPSGSKIQVANTFGSTIKSGVTYSSDGSVDFKSTSSAGYTFNTGSNIESQNYTVQIYSGGVYNAGASYNQGVVTAGTATLTPPATLTSFGSFASKGKLKTSNFTVDNTAQVFYCDASNANVCSGTPTTSCAATSPANESSCNARSDLGCSWVSGGNCGDYSNTDSGTCTGANAACSWETSSCSAFNNDSAGCTGAGWPSGGFCSFTPNSCADFAGSQAACDAEFGNGCSSDLSSCSTWDGTDESICQATSPCVWNSGDNTCTGTYFTGCSGSYTGGGGTCSGTYDTGNCTGGSFGSCTGTASCGGLSSSGACGAESGCTWTSGMTATLPAISSTATSSAGSEVGETTAIWVGIKNVGASGNVTVTPAAGDTIEWASSSLVVGPQPSPTPSQVPTNFVMLHPLILKGQCSTFNNNESSCNANSPCSWTLNTCGSYTDSGACGTASGCSWNTDTSSCEGTYTGSDGTCSGTYITSKKWMRW